MKQCNMFKLVDGHIDVSTITHHNGIWEFHYTDAFKGSHDTVPITDFPDKSKVYTSHEPWAFLLMRIPNTKRSDVMEHLKSHGIDTSDTVRLLAEFGRRCISNPYILVYQG